MKGGVKSYALKALAVLVSTLPPIAATLTYFPLWRNHGTAALVSGFTLILLLLGIVPLIKLFKRLFSAPSATLLWLSVFIIFFLLSKIADEMVVISFVGFTGNLSGDFLWRLGGGKK
jgi:hypothetical protein